MLYPNRSLAVWPSAFVCNSCDLMITARRMFFLYKTNKGLFKSSCWWFYLLIVSCVKVLFCFHLFTAERD